MGADLRSRHRTRIVALVSLVVLVVGQPAGVGADAATAGEIEIRVSAAPDVIGGLTPRLVLDGADVTSTYCSMSNDGTYDWLDCVGLPDGTYDVEVDGVPSGARTTVNCDDIVAGYALRPLIQIDNGFTEWSCTVYVGTPAVLLGVGVGYDPGPPAGPTGRDRRHARTGARCHPRLHRRHDVRRRAGDQVPRPDPGHLPGRGLGHPARPDRRSALRL